MRMFTSNLKLLTTLVVFTMIAACGDSGFTGGSGKRIAGTEAGGQTGAEANHPSTAKGNPNESSPGDLTNDKFDPVNNSDDKAIGKCLEKFGTLPFDAAPSYRKISASVQVFGVGRGIVDDQRTSAPELVLISAAVNVLGESVYELKNPNGWYCLKVDVNVKANTVIKLHCDAKIADNKVNVAVGGNAQAAGQVGVHVLSDVKIERIGDCVD